MSPREAARLLGVSTSTIYRRIRSGEIAAVKRGRRWHITGTIGAPKMEWMKWPASNVALAFPVGMPSDVALLGLCDMPADTPVDGPGLALSMVKFQIHTAEGAKLAEEAALPHEGKVRCVFGRKDLTALWKRLGPGLRVPVRVTAYPRFYRLDEAGAAHLEGDDRGYHKGEEVRSPLYTLSMNDGAELTIDGKTEPRPGDPGPTAEEQAEIDASDRQMREEREAHERQEREIRERAARENREHNEREARERRKREQEQRRLQDQLDAQRKREDEERERERQRAAAERKRLGIRTPDSDVSKALNDPPSEDGLYLAFVNAWEGMFAPDDTDGFKAFLTDKRQDSRFTAAVDEVCKRLNWKLLG